MSLFISHVVTIQDFRRLIKDIRCYNEKKKNEGYISQRRSLNEYSSQGTCEVTKEEFSRQGHMLSSWFLNFFFLKERNASYIIHDIHKIIVIITMAQVRYSSSK